MLYVCTVTGFNMLKFIPIKAQAGIIGFESPATPYTKAGLDLSELLIDKPSATFIGQASGTSMQDGGIFDNDLLIVSRAEEVTDMCIVVATLNGAFVCKRIDRVNKCLRSDSDHPPYFLRDGDEFSVEGVVIRSVRMHKPINLSVVD